MRDVKAEVDVGIVCIRIELIQSISNLLRASCHILQRFQNRQTTVLDTHHSSKACPNAEDTGKLPIGKYFPCFLQQDLTWVVVAKTSIDELDFISTASDGFEVGSGRRSRASDLPDRTILETRRRIVRLK